MQPAIAPIGLDYIAGAAKQAGIETDIVDLCLVQNPETALRDYFALVKAVWEINVDQPDNVVLGDVIEL